MRNEIMTDIRPSNEIHINRIYNASIAEVWDAWCDPKKASQWWGPRGFTITTHAKDLRPGGIWHYTMHGPDGVDYPNKTKYLEIEHHSKLVYDHGGNDEQEPLFRVTVSFSEEGDKTRMHMIMALPTAQAAEEIRVFIKKAGGDATWDRLAEYLAKEKEDREIFVINRTFRSTKEKMAKVWTDPAHLSQWLPPTEFTMEFIHAEIKPGGSSIYAMTNGREVEMYGRCQYLQITPQSLQYSQQFCDKDEKISRHPFAPTWPASMMTTISFEEEDQNHTRVTVTWEPHGDVTGEELKTFQDGRAGMTQGWTGSFDKLEGYLATL